MAGKYNQFNQSYRPDETPGLPNVKVKTVLKCRDCHTERKTEISVPQGTVVESVTLYSCTTCCGLLKANGEQIRHLALGQAPALAEHRAAQRAANAARLPEVQEPSYSLPALGNM